MTRTLTVVRALRTAPALAPLLAPVRLAAAFRSETAVAELHRELRSVATRENDAIWEALVAARLGPPKEALS